ncbi:hypothetical protein BUALT_Bualt08G0099500 [Buddleja alternifolia]|uniref:Uncharacterized protein n=1 Tax=Buddleja alternifolia TaxID=168488 RepID=A0AAV6XCE4_9LAMI|nr:hypothetical protein BUALT_Bualt08G0099500 [Buddleja alternifolia]
MEKENNTNKQETEEEGGGGQKHLPPKISPMQPLTKDAYGGGMYAAEEGPPQPAGKPPASATQSADGPAEANIQPKHKPPPSTGDRDLDITGQSYIQ